MSEGNHLRLVRAFTVDEHIRKSAQGDSARLVSSLDVGYLRADTGNISIKSITLWTSAMLPCVP